MTTTAAAAAMMMRLLKQSRRWRLRVALGNFSKSSFCSFSPLSSAIRRTHGWVRLVAGSACSCGWRGDTNAAQSEHARGDALQPLDRLARAHCEPLVLQCGVDDRHMHSECGNQGRTVTGASWHLQHKNRAPPKRSFTAAARERERAASQRETTETEGHTPSKRARSWGTSCR
jgi:hypothetical protein